MDLGLEGALIIVGVLLVGWALGRRSRDPSTLRGYFLASGTLGSSAVGATYVGANLTFTAIFLILSEESHRRGWIVACVPIFWILGTLLFIKLYPKVATAIRSGQMLHAFIGGKYGSTNLRKLAGVWTIAAFVGTVALEFYGGIRLLKWGGLPLFANLSLSLTLAFLCTAITVTGGMRGLGRSDKWMDAVMLVGVAVLGWLLVMEPTKPAVSASLLPHGSALDYSYLIGMAVIFVPFQFCVLDQWQRCAAWERSSQSPSKWLIPGAAILAVCYLVPIWIGVQVRESGIAVRSDEHPLVAFLTAHHLPRYVVGVLAAGFIAAIVSTADELLNCCSMSMLLDVLQVKPEELLTDPARCKRVIVSAKVYTGLFAFASGVIAVLCIAMERRIADLAVALFGAQVAFTVPIFAAIGLGSRARGYAVAAIASVLAALMVTLGSVVIGWVSGDREWIDAAPVYAATAAVALFAFVALCQRAAKRSRA